MTQKISVNPIPNHVAIVPDGNRRWAKSRGLEPWMGHEQGAKIIEEISREALKLGIKYITFWGSSADNLTKRPFDEKRHLLKIYEKYFKKLIEGDDVYRNKTKIGIFGRWREQFPAGLTKLLESGIEKTKSHSGNFLNFLLAYSGDDEIVEAMKRIVAKMRSSNCELEIGKETLKENLMTKELPQVDFLIRTGVQGDPHNSAGFLMWQTRDSQYYFSEKMFPDFNAQQFKKAIEDFSLRVRRFGK